MTCVLISRYEDRFGSKEDIKHSNCDVCFTPESGHQS
jgi:hypothetical protein